MTCIFPKNSRLDGRALALLLQGERISHRDFQNHAASYRLSSNIEKLRNHMGWPISDVWLDGPTTDKTGRCAQFKRYFFKPEHLAELKEYLGERMPKYIETVKGYEAGCNRE